ncbi:MAG: hypothetical protein ACI89J_004464, partial [Hyphomicrobiaceae bacterium]
MSATVQLCFLMLAALIGFQQISFWWLPPLTL